MPPAQFGKNHFGDLYHLSAEEEPKLYELALPHGMLKCLATDDLSREPDDPKFGPLVSRSSRTPARWTPSGWKPSTTQSSTAEVPSEG
jgi:hypothetical protein